MEICQHGTYCDQTCFQCGERFPPLFKPCPNRIGLIPASSKANFTYRGRFCAYPYINLPLSARLGARSLCLWVTAQCQRCYTRHLSLNRYRPTYRPCMAAKRPCVSVLVLNPNAEFHGHRFAGAKVLICRQLLLRPLVGAEWCEVSGAPLGGQ
jgi:hypothetical protein